MFTVIDKQGRISVPASYRKKLDLKVGDPVKVTLQENKLIVEPDTVTVKCKICDCTTIEGTFKVGGIRVPLCEDCRKAIEVGSIK